MTDENPDQLALDFPDPDEFPSYDDVDSDEAEAELPADSADESSATQDEVGCGCVQ